MPAYRPTSPKWEVWHSQMSPEYNSESGYRVYCWCPEITRQQSPAISGPTSKASSKQLNHSAPPAGITDMGCLAQLNDPQTQLQRVVTGQIGGVPKLPDTQVQLFRTYQ